MARIKVIFKGHNDVILCDYNGQRYAFPKNKPIEVPTEVYNFVVRSGSVDAVDLQVYTEPEDVLEPPKEEVSASPKEVKKKSKK